MLVRFLRSSLRVKSFTLFFCSGILGRVSGESLPHVLVPLVLLVDEMVGGCDVVVSVSFETSDRVLFFELKVANEPAE